MSRSLIISNKNPIAYQLYLTLLEQKEYVIYTSYSDPLMDKKYLSDIKPYSFKNQDELLEIVNKLDIDTIYYLDPLYTELISKQDISINLYQNILTMSLRVSSLLKIKIIIVTTQNPFEAGKMAHNKAVESLIYNHIQNNQIDICCLHLPYVIPTLSINPDNNKNFFINILLKAVKEDQYICPIQSGIFMDIIYIHDAIHAIMRIREIDSNDHNPNLHFEVKGLTVDSETIYVEIWRHYPNFNMIYHIDNNKQSLMKEYIHKNKQSRRNILQDWKPLYTTKKMLNDLIYQLTR